MKNPNLFSLFLLVLLSSYACKKTSPGNSPASNNSKEVLILDDFENQSALTTWNGPISLSKEFPAHGKSSLELKSSDGESLWLESEKLPKDWSSYDLLKFDIYNPSSKLYYGYIQICDEHGTDEQVEFFGQSYNWQKVFLNTGWNHFEFLLQKAMVEEGDRPLALDKIRKFRLSFSSIDHSIYLDNIRLVSGEESAKTVSRIDPRDCRIVIDDRYVYPTLAGPVEKIKPGPGIIQLRELAKEAVQKLEKEVEIAELQGYQTLYQRIPLITANIGLGIRSKLVWFQNDKEEKKILQYVIASCSEASKKIEVILSTQKSNIPVLAPEDETTSQTFYVPPYPPFNELKPIDGFYRDKAGKPVIVFSMLQINNGPLMDYFAPFTHRLESYTVGGGSRYNIESSPVYEAFHKYPGTHRVGWDGWCGHLIKDRWAMGGKKEDVVICLESPHIRQAVLDFMKKHHSEWKKNPDLLYNIMAYELQYICYCEKSQQMFRDRLKTKYDKISVLNQLWDTQYQSFSQIKAPATHNTRPVDDVNRAAWYDWACFNTRRFTDYLKWVKNEMRKFDQEIPICAGGTSSMLSSSNSVSGIDEEMIINEVDDIILNESGRSTIFSDLLLSLSEKKKVMVDPEMGGGTHGILLQFLHGKSDISKWWWASAPSREYLKMNQSSLPHSKTISLSDIDEVLRIGLDVRRLSSEIAEFTRPEPEVAILYSKTSIVQVPPHLVQAGRTPYINAVYSVWEGSRFLGCRIGFVSEKQILSGKLTKFKLLIIPAVKYIKPEVVTSIINYIKEGGTAVIIPESFIFDQYAREHNRMSELDINITDVTLPPLLGEGEKVQNYDQSFSQKIVYGEVRKNITTLNRDIFENNTPPLTLFSDGLVQSIDPGSNQVLARFDDGKAAIVLAQIGNGNLYYLAAPLKTKDYHILFSPLAKKLELKRPVVGVDKEEKLITGVEVRSVEREADYLVYASNLTPEPVEFDLKGPGKFGIITDLRSLHEIPDGHVKLGPYQETIYKVEKKEGPGIKPKKYVALSTDTEAYFTPRDFENFQGEFTQQMIDVCDKYNVPFTWLIIVDKEHIEVRTFTTKVFPARKDIDEFSLHVHFKWFIMDYPDDFKSFKIVERRMKWMKDAKAEIIKAGLPMPGTFRYGGSDSKDRYYCIEDLILLNDEFGIRNYLFSPDRLQGIIGITRYEHKENNVWIIDGGREITLLSTCVYLDKDEETIITAIDQRLESADYAIIGSHDYREVVPEHMAIAIEHLNANYNVEYVTIDRIGEMVRSGEIRNNW